MAVLAGMAGGSVLMLGAYVPQPLVLPVVSLGSIALAGLTALFAWWNGSQRCSSTVTGWDISGAFALIGCGAAILSDTENVLQLFGPVMGRN
jgi:hypothetical protein